MLKKITILLTLILGLILLAGCANQITTEVTTTLSTTDSPTTNITTTYATTTVLTTEAPTTQEPTTVVSTQEPTTEATTNYLTSIVDSLVIDDIISNNFYLPAEIGAVTVSWSTINTEYLDISTEVTIYEDKFAYEVLVIKPDYETGDQTVTITGIFQHNSEEISRDFSLTISKIPADYYLDIDLALIESSYTIENEFSLPELDYANYQNVNISIELTDYLSYSNEQFVVIRPENDVLGSISFDVVYGDAIQSVVVNITVKKALEVVEGSTLFISQYVEGSSYNKYIEIYNSTSETVDLSEFTLELYSNVATVVSQTMTLSGTLNPGSVIVLGHPSGTIFTEDLSNSTVINFNGNDALVLKHNGVIIDSIGQIGNIADYAVDVTLIRMPGITSGDTDPYDVFTLDEWQVLATDSATDLGSHTT